MKKFFILLAVLITLTFSDSNAEQSTMIGAGLGYGADIKELNIQFGAIIDIDAPVDLAPDLKYYLIGNGVSAWELNANVYYNFSKSESTIFYALAGLQFAKSTGFNGDLGLNLGVGANINISGFNLLPEIKFSIGGTEQLHLGATAMFPI